MSRKETNSSKEKFRYYNELRESIIKKFGLTGKKLMHPFFSCLLIQDPKNLGQLEEQLQRAGFKSAEINFFREIQRQNPVLITDLIKKILSPGDTKSRYLPLSDQEEITNVLKTKFLKIDNDPNTLYLLQRPCFIDTKDGSQLAVVAQDLLPDGTVVISIRKIENVGEKPVIFIFTPAIDKNGMHTYLCIKSNSQDIDPRGITEEELLLLLNAGIVLVPSLKPDDPKNKIYLSLQSNPNQIRFSRYNPPISMGYPHNPSLQAIEDSGLLGIQEPDAYIQVVELLTRYGMLDNDILDYLSKKETFSDNDAKKADLLELRKKYCNYLSDPEFTKFLEEIKGFFVSLRGEKILIDLGMTQILWQVYRRKKKSSVDLFEGIDGTLNVEQGRSTRNLLPELIKQQIIEAIILLSEPGNSESSILMRTVLSSHSSNQLLKLLRFLIEKTGVPLGSSSDVLETAKYLISQMQIGSNLDSRQGQQRQGMFLPIQVILNPPPTVPEGVAGTGLVGQKGRRAQISTGTMQGSSENSYPIVKKTPLEGISLTVENLIVQLDYCVNNSLPFILDPKEFPILRFSTDGHIDREFAKLKILSAFLTQNPREAERLFSEISQQIRDSGSRYFLKLALKATEYIINSRRNRIQDTREVLSYYEKLIPKLQNYSPEKLYEIIVLAILDYGFWVSNQEIDPSLLNIIDKCIREAHENLSQQATKQLSLVRRETGGHQTGPELVRGGRKRTRFPKFKREDLYRLVSTLGLISILYFGGRHINDQVLNPRITISLDEQGNVLSANSISSLQDHLASLFRKIFVQGEDKIEECKPPKNPIFEEVNSKPSQDLVNRTRDMKLIGEIDQEYGDKNFVNLEKDKVYFVVVYNNEGEPVVVTSFLGMDAEIRRTEGMVLSKVFLLPEEIEDIFDTIPKPICDNPRYNNLLNQGGIQAIVVTVESNRSNSRVSIMGNHRVRIPSLDRLLGIEAPQIKSSGIIRKDVLLIEVPYELTK